MGISYINMKFFQFASSTSSKTEYLHMDTSTYSRLKDHSCFLSVYVVFYSAYFYQMKLHQAIFNHYNIKCVAIFPRREGQFTNKNSNVMIFYLIDYSVILSLLLSVWVLCFIYKLFNGIINCSELLVKFNFLVPGSRI